MNRRTSRLTSLIGGGRIKPDQRLRVLGMSRRRMGRPHRALARDAIADAAAKDVALNPNRYVAAASLINR